MLHEPSTTHEPDHASGTKMRLGAWMFLIYAVVYAGFVAINVFNPVLMEARVLFGMNLASVYGFGLIIFALVLALIYNKLCKTRETAAAAASEQKEAE